MITPPDSLMLRWSRFLHGTSADVRQCVSRSRVFRVRDEAHHEVARSVDLGAGPPLRDRRSSPSPCCYGQGQAGGHPSRMLRVELVPGHADCARSRRSPTRDRARLALQSRGSSTRFLGRTSPPRSRTTSAWSPVSSLPCWPTREALASTFGRCTDQCSSVPSGSGSRGCVTMVSGMRAIVLVS